MMQKVCNIGLQLPLNAEEESELQQLENSLEKHAKGQAPAPAPSPGAPAA